MDSSTTFVCVLPPMDAERTDKLREWARESCVKFDLAPTTTTITLIGVYPQSKGLREHQRLIRKTLVELGVQLPASLPSGWVRLIPEDCYETATEPANETADAPQKEAPAARSAAFVADLPDGITPDQLEKL